MSNATLLGIAYASSGADLIPGSPAALFADADALVARAEALEQNAGRLRSVSTGHWAGDAADAFDEARDSTRKQLLNIADAYSSAAAALRAHGEMLTWGQGVADGLVESWQRADALGDPGTGRKRSIDLALSEVRAQVATSGDQLARALRSLNELVPPAPTFWSELVGGAADAFGDLWSLVEQQNAVRKIVDPQGWMNDTAAMVVGFKQSLNDPKQLAKDSVDWDTWANSPPRAVGHMAPDGLTNILTGGVGGILGKAATTAARKGTDIAEDGAAWAARRASLGESATTNYRKTFFEAYPDLQGQVVVHHAVEQSVLRRYPGVVTESQMHSLENLRGIPNDANPRVHLSEIRRLWNRFYEDFPSGGAAPTTDDLLDYATSIDLQVGQRFLPPVE
ncbi:putative T7SS-secreted protein [Cellulomonas sp. GbtcB1]|uniref:putative T7SS-secreted protein n=1 Tax=Cellulomonas sp. GbtcB1 TaxID=2824746 RepID=UPI001C302537|nr:hypothetical protein [Cellulomonas sp. GbtcB1]